MYDVAALGEEVEVGTKTTSPQYVHVETALTLRDRAASIRWVASTERLHNEAKALLEFAERLEAEAFNMEAQNSGQHAVASETELAR